MFLYGARKHNYNLVMFFMTASNVVLLCKVISIPLWVSLFAVIPHFILYTYLCYLTGKEFFLISQLKRIRYNATRRQY